MTRVLDRIARGESSAAEDLLPLVYQELKQLAQRHRRKLPAGHTLQTTALVHEAWMRLGSPQEAGWQNRAHFYGAAAIAMRRILVDELRSRNAQKRRRPEGDVDAELVPALEASSVDLLALDEALDRLEREHARPARVVMLRFFAGLSHPEIAEALDLTVRTVNRDWAFARTWLWRRLADRSAEQ